MSILKNTLALVIITSLLIGCSSSETLQNTPIGLINNVSYKQSSFDNPNASNGFLVQYENTTYAITAKPVLMIAKTDHMSFVDFEGGLKEWRMHPKNDSSKYVITDKLLSVSRKDSLTWNYMNTNWDTYNDWLVFSVKENMTAHKPLTFRKEPLKKGESLYAVGWTYKDSIGKQRVYEYKFDKTEGNYHTLIQIQGPKSLGGLSGAPIVDGNGSVVGLVSSGWEDDTTKQVFIEATTMSNVIEFISNLN